MANVEAPGDASLGSFVIGLRPRQRCVFRIDPARSLHAALLRRLEGLDPALAAALHDAPDGSHGVARPWTVSRLSGDFQAHPEGLLAPAGGRYWARVTALAAPVVTALRLALDPTSAPPLELEHVVFDPAEADPSAARHWSKTTTYTALLEEARPLREITLAWLSPTTFRRGQGHAAMPEPRLCLASYLRRWSAFAHTSLRLPEESLLRYAAEGITVADARLSEQAARLGRFCVRGHVGHVTWRCAAASDELLRQINALADYAFFCGTGVKTALGMGQTIRLKNRSGTPVK